MRKIRRPNRPGPAGTASVPQPSTSQASFARPSTTPSNYPPKVQQVASNAPKDRPGHVKDDALDLAVTIVSVGKEAASTLSVPGLAPGLSAFGEVLKKIQAMSQTAKGVGNLKQEADALAELVKDFTSRNPGETIPDALQETINELTIKWTKIEESAARIVDRGKIKRFLSSASDAKELQNLVGDISLSIRNATLLGGWDIRLAVDRVEHKLDAMADQQAGERMPPYAESAAYDAVSARPREPCLEGTREDTLEDIWTWIKLHARDPAPVEDTQGQGSALTSTEETLCFIYWVCGLAGTGKTTIACSIAERCKSEGILGGSFFFSRFDSKCDNARLLFTTISRQLCGIHPEYKANVIEVMKTNPAIIHAVPAEQFKALILEPLERLKEPFPRLTLVLDALDECRVTSNTSDTLHILSRFKERAASFFLIVMTSRPEPELLAHLGQSDSRRLGKVEQLFLHMAKLEPVLKDIKHFLTHHLEKSGRRFPRGRPSDEDITALSDLSNGLFIFASTAVKLMLDRQDMQPVKTLERIVERQSNRSSEVTVLHELYRQVLDEAHPKADDELEASIRQVVGALVVSAEPLSIATLAGVLDVPEDLIRNILSELYSVLHVPDDDSQPVHFIHPTFPEFLLQASPVRSLPSRFSFEAADQHYALLIRCLMIMNALLRYDIAHLRDICIFKKEVSDLPGRIQQHIPSHLSYACRSWFVHFKLGSGSTIPTTLHVSSHRFLHQHPLLWNWIAPFQRRSRPSASTTLHTLFSEFLHQHLLCWLEMCSLLNTLSEVPAALDAARHTCQSLEGSFADLVPFLLDARRFTLTYAPCIDAAPLQVYHSALVLAPRSSIVSQTYSHARPMEALAVCRGAPSEWGSALDSFISHGGQGIHAVAFSPDNTFFVSGGGDKMVKVWKASTRTLVLDIQTSTSIYAVAYSPSGLHIAAGGSGGLSIWHVASGAQVCVITDDDIGRVAYTADGSHLLSVNLESKVQLWRLSDGECLLSLNGDRDTQAGISPNGAVIAFIRGASLLLHDVSSGKHESLELPEQGWTATFSSDGRYVAAATMQAIWIWSYQDKLLVRSIDIKAFFLSRLSFSPDGSSICCGDGRGTVHVWPAEGDGPARELKGHTGLVRDVAWSPDGSQIVSASSGGNIWLWDVINQLSTAHLNTSSYRPSSGPPRVLVAERRLDFTILNLPPYPSADLFLPSRNDSTADDVPTFTAHPNCAAAWDHIVQSGTPAAGLQDRTYRWAALTGQNEYSRRATIAISNNGSLVAYPVAGSIHIHNLTTGELVTTFTPEFESGSVRCISFSPDDSLLASGSQKLREHSGSDFKDTATVAVWNVAAGACVAYHRDHSHDVRCITFSSDGRFVVSGSEDRTARVYDISTKQVTHVLEPHDDWVMEVMLTTDDRLLVTQDDLGALYIWNIKTDSRVAFFPLSDDFWITTLHFSPTGLSVFIEGGEHTVELWKVGRRAWPVYFVSKEGWVYAKGPGYTRRLAWLPPEWRYPVCSDGAAFCVCEVEREKISRWIRPKLRMQRLIELDMSRLLDLAGILYNK